MEILMNDEIAVDSLVVETKSNTATVNCIENAEIKSGVATVTINKTVVLSIEKKAAPDVVTSGIQNIVTFTIMVTNEGPSKATGVVISDTVPPEFNVTAVTSTGTVHWTSGTNVFTVDGITLNKNAEVTVTVTTTFIG